MALVPHAAAMVVGAAVIWNLVVLRAESLPVSYLNDSSIHEQMVRFATAQFRAGHVPLTSWFPYLGLGSPQFLHYQSLPAMLTGLAGLMVGPNAAFRWSLYILLSVWPISVYLGARWFGFDRWAAAASAVVSPFLVSVTGVGYEQKAYLWIGYGVWAQLWASVTLPLAWGATWRAMKDGRGYFLSVALISLTAAFHFETGYLAVLPLLMWPLVSRKGILMRVRRAVLIGGGVVLISAWIIVPLISQRPWAATNEVLARSPLVNGYGAGRVLGWLLSGQLLDAGRLPVITVFALVGLAIAVWRWRGNEKNRALLLILGGCIVLSSGRTTLGPIVGVIPGSQDLFFRRFMMGIQLAALLLAGFGIAGSCRMGWVAVQRVSSHRRSRQRVRLGNRYVYGGLLFTIGILLLAPALVQLWDFNQRNALAIQMQARADRVQGMRWIGC